MRKTSQAGIFTRIFLFLFGAVFAGAGGLFLYVLGSNALGVLQSYSWENVEATIVSSKIVENRKADSPFTLELTYRYNYQGQEYTSNDRYAGSIFSRTSYSDYTDAVKDHEKYAIHTKHEAIVDPAEPTRAALERGNVFTLLLVLFPIPFLAIGLLVMFAAFAANSEENTPVRSSLSRQQKRSGSGKIAGVIFSLIFLITGLCLGYFLGYLQWRNIENAKSWPQVDATVEFSRVKVHHSDDGTTYSPDIFYRYTVDGKTYKSNRYRFDSHSTGNRSAANQIAQAYSSGKLIKVYVDPNNPASAVINRDAGIGLYLSFFISLIFSAVGFFLLLTSLRSKPKSRTTVDGRSSSAAAHYYSGPTVPAHSAGKLELTASSTPLMRLIGSILIALFWNGIVSVFLYQVIHDWQRGQAPYFLTIFLTPFVLIGLLLLYMTLHTFLMLFNPRVRLVLNSAALQPGSTSSASWTLTGKISRIQQLKITLIGKEQATFRQGTSTSTDTQVFYRQELLAQRKAESRGSFTIPIPANTMHSFSALNNKIIWELEVHGDIPRWPDLRETFEITILPEGAIQ